MSNYLNTTSNTLANSLVYTSNALSSRITNLSADQITDGTTKRFIISNTYNNDLIVKGKLTASNLDIIGETTTIKTSTYQTENLEIITQATDGPAFKIIQNGSQNLVDMYDTNSNVFTITKAGRIGIANTNPSEKLDVVGNIKFTGSINNVTSTQLDYINGVTSSIQTQLNNTNTYTSNYITISSNTLANSLVYTSNALSSRVTALNSTINSLSTDTLSQGVHNKYIIDNIYDNNLTVTGTLTASEIIILEFDQVYGANGMVINTDLNTYINTVTSNYVKNNYNQSQWISSGNNIYYNSGNVGVGITTPASALHVSGTILATGNITANYSDERLKTILNKIDDPLNIINRLNGFYYEANSLANDYGLISSKKEIGLSAQEMNNILPELVSLAPFDTSNIATDAKHPIFVSKSGENYLTISYERLAPVFVESIKELHKQMQAMQKTYTDEINDLKNEIKALKQKLQ
jgi:hypothetical protein